MVLGVDMNGVPVIAIDSDKWSILIEHKRAESPDRPLLRSVVTQKDVKELVRNFSEPPLKI